MHKKFIQTLRHKKIFVVSVFVIMMPKPAQAMDEFDKIWDSNGWGEKSGSRYTISRNIWLNDQRSGISSSTPTPSKKKETPEEYRQRHENNKKEREEREKQKKEYEVYKKSDEYQQMRKERREIAKEKAEENTKEYAKKLGIVYDEYTSYEELQIDIAKKKEQNLRDRAEKLGVIGADSMRVDELWDSIDKRNKEIKQKRPIRYTSSSPSRYSHSSYNFSSGSSREPEFDETDAMIRRVEARDQYYGGSY